MTEGRLEVRSKLELQSNDISVFRSLALTILGRVIMPPETRETLEVAISKVTLPLYLVKDCNSRHERWHVYCNRVISAVGATLNDGKECTRIINAFEKHLKIIGG